MDQVMALENGGDDFITKPFHADVVMAKVRSQLRRAYGAYSSNHQEQVIELDGLKLYPERFELHFANQEIRLTKKKQIFLKA